MAGRRSNGGGGPQRRTGGRVPAVVIAVVGLTVGGCGGGGTSPKRETAAPTTAVTAVRSGPATSSNPVAPTTSLMPEPATTPAPTVTPVIRTPAVATTVVDRPLGRRDLPPGAVTAQFGPGILALTGTCDPLAAPAITPEAREIGLGSSVVLCLSGFDPAPPARIEARFPDGQVRQLGSPVGTDSKLPTTVLDPVGVYSVTATQGSRTATSTVTVTLPKRPVIETLDPVSGPAGTRFRFAVAMPIPDQAVTLDLFRGPSYLTTLEARSDGGGRLVYEVPSFPGDPLGDYCLWHRGGDTCAAFQVT